MKHLVIQLILIIQLFALSNNLFALAVSSEIQHKSSKLSKEMQLTAVEALVSREFQGKEAAFSLKHVYMDHYGKVIKSRRRDMPFDKRFKMKKRERDRDRLIKKIKEVKEANKDKTTNVYDRIKQKEVWAKRKIIYLKEKGDTFTLDEKTILWTSKDKKIVSVTKIKEKIESFKEERNIVELFELLKNYEDSFGQEIVKVLVGIGEEEVINGLLAILLNKEGVFIEDLAIEALVKIGTEAVPYLIEALESKDIDVKNSIAKTLVLLGKKAVPNLIEELKKNNKNVIIILSQIGREAVFNLMKILDEEEISQEIKKSAVWILGRIGDAWAVQGLIRVLDIEVLEIRKLAIEALGRIKNKVAVPGLINALKDKEEIIRQLAAKSLEMIGEAAVTPLIDALKDEEEQVRNLIKEILVNIGKEGVLELIKELKKKKEEEEEAINQFAESGIGSSSRRGSTASSIGGWSISSLRRGSTVSSRGGWPVPGSRRGSTTSSTGRFSVVSSAVNVSGGVWADDLEDDIVKESIVQVLGDIGDIRAVPRLVVLLKREENKRLKIFIIEALGKLGGEEATEGLVAVLRVTNKRSETVKSTILTTLGDSGDVSIISDLEKETRSWKQGVRDAAKESLQKLDLIKLENVEDLLLKLDGEDKMFAVRALAKIGNEESISKLIDLLNHTDDELKEAAQEALINSGEVFILKLIQALKDTKIKSCVKDILVKIGKPACSRLLESLKQEKDRNIIKDKVKVLIEIDEFGFISFIQKLEDKEYSLKIKIADILKDTISLMQIIDVIKNIIASDAVSELIDLFNKTNEEKLKEAIMESMKNMEKIKELIQMLRSETDEENVFLIKKTLIEIGVDVAPSLAALLQKLTEKEELLKLFIIDILGELGASEILFGLVCVLKDKVLLDKIAEELNKIDNQKFVMFINVLGEEHLELKEIWLKRLLLKRDTDTALKIINNIAKEKLIFILFRLLKNEDFILNKFAVTELIKRDKSAFIEKIKSLKEEDWKLKIDILRSLIDEDVELLKIAVSVVQKIKDKEALISLLDFFKSECWKVTIDGQQILIIGIEAIPTLLKLLNDFNITSGTFVRFLAIKALGQMKAKQAIQPLKILLSFIRDEDNICVTVEALWNIEQSEIISQLLEEFKDKDQRNYILNVLKSSQFVFEILEECLKQEKNKDVIKDIVEILKEIDSAKLENFLENAENKELIKAA
jgi:HEAT repeat protein